MTGHLGFLVTIMFLFDDHKKAINRAGLENFSSQMTTSSTSSSFEPRMTFLLASQGASAGTRISSMFDLDLQLILRERLFELDFDLAKREIDNFLHVLISFFNFLAFGF